MKKLFAILTKQVWGIIGPRFVVSDSVTHHMKQFKEAVQELAGGPQRCYLKETIGYESCTGEVAYIDGIKPATDAGTVTTLANLKGRYAYDQLTTPTQAQLVDHLLTQNDTVEVQRTHLAPVEIKIGKWFVPSEKNFLEYTDPTSRKMKALMSGYYYKEEQRIINAIFAATQNRGQDDGTNLSAVAMPASQVLDDMTYADIDIKIFSEISKRFQLQYVSGEKIFYGMGPTEWQNLVDNSGEKLLNQDYVRDARHFETGDLPDVFGVVPVVHPIFEDTTTLTALGLLGAGETALHAAWTEGGITWGEFDGRSELMEGPSAAFDGQCIARVAEYANACRNDDLRVLNGAVLTA